MREDDLVHPNRQCEIVRRIFEQRIAPDVNLVKKHVRQKRRQPERLPVGDEVNLVASAGESDTELRRDSTRSAIGGITSDPDLHVSSFHHRSTAAAHSGSSGSTRVTLLAPSW